MILVDTSVWIDFFAGRALPQVQTLEHLLQTDADLALCGVVLTEVLQAFLTINSTKPSKITCPR
jgi:predicted nucleic acid-binding protein